MFGAAGFVALGWVLLRPDLSTCEYSGELCVIEHGLTDYRDLLDNVGDFEDDGPISLKQVVEATIGSDD